MTLFQDHLLREGVRILSRFPKELLSEIYVVSFRIWRVDGDPRHPYVAIGYNTESQFREELALGSPDPAEVRWNYAYWFLEGFERLGNVPDDAEGSRFYVEEVKRLGLWRDGDEDTGGALSEDEEDARYEQLGQHFADNCVELARRLHAGGHLIETFGQPLPIVVFDMDSPGWEVEATEAANPGELIEGFREFNS